MRIVGGSHRGRKLLSPLGREVRPTSDKTRQAVFNALNHRGAVADAVALDAFCGTGALGLEALSQGAAQAIFFDNTRSSLDLVKRNAKDLSLESQSTILLKDALKCGVKPADITAADLVFLDPPYNKNMVVPAAQALKEGGWLANAGWLVVEVEKGASLHGLIGTIESEKNYGATSVYLVQF